MTASAEIFGRIGGSSLGHNPVAPSSACTEAIAQQVLTLPEPCLPFVLGIVHHSANKLRAELRDEIGNAVRCEHGGVHERIARSSSLVGAWTQYLAAGESNGSLEGQRTEARCLRQIEGKGVLRFAIMATQWVKSLPADCHCVSGAGSSRCTALAEAVDQRRVS